MRPHGVIVLPPSLDDDLGLGTRAKPFETEAFVTEFAVEALGDAILPGLAGLDQRGADTLPDDPGQQRFRHELRAVVAAQKARRAVEQRLMSGADGTDQLAAPLLRAADKRLAASLW